MAPPKAPIPSAAGPKHGDHFDAWNSSSTGHQRAENKVSGSIGWRQSRSVKLSHQFKSGRTGGSRIADQVGAGSDNWDEKSKALIPKVVAARASVSVRDMLVSGKHVIASSLKEVSMVEKDLLENAINTTAAEPCKPKRGIFDGLVIYINGSTYPLISDHKLKYLLAENGAKLSIHLGRRQVTHTILGRPCGTKNAEAGAGGGLAVTKIQKEIKRIGGCGIKYVGVEWVLESLRQGIRLPETQFSNLKVAAKGQQSVYGIFKTSRSH